jgi:hypothetical protein
MQTGHGLQGGNKVESNLAFSCCERHSFSSLTFYPFPSPCWPFPRFLIIKTSMAPSVSSKTQFARLERTWRFSCRAHARVVGPCIVCMGVINSSSSFTLGFRGPNSGVKSQSVLGSSLTHMMTHGTKTNVTSLIYKRTSV